MNNKTKLRNDFGECRAWVVAMCGAENAAEDDDPCDSPKSVDGGRSDQK